MEKQGSPQHAWDNVAPEIVHQEIICQAERPVANADLKANELMLLGSQAQEYMDLLFVFILFCGVTALFSDVSCRGVTALHSNKSVVFSLHYDN